MKKLIFCAIVCVIGAQLLAAAPEWLTSVSEAEARAKNENKLVLLNFTGSDWCVACKRMDAEVFSKPEFASYASTNLELVELDYPLDKKQPKELKDANNALQIKYNVEGFPTFYALKPDGAVVWKHEGFVDGGLPALIAELNKARNK
jgi:thiol:disulfide interchange protein